jgi:hypothetical protein
MGDTIQDPAHAARLAAMLADNAILHSRLDPAFAAYVADHARALHGHATISSIIAAAPAPPRRKHLVTGAQKAIAATQADEWLQDFLRVVVPEDGDPLPSNRTIFVAAAARDPAPPRRVIEQAIFRRWPERKPKDKDAPK